MSPDRPGPWPPPPPDCHLSAELLERDLQAKCVTWWHDSGLPGILFHVPNEGKRSRIEAAALGALGVLTGAPDFVLLLPSARVHLIELKTPTGEMSWQQRDFRSLAVRLGHTYSVIRSIEEFRWDVASAVRHADPAVVDFCAPVHLP